MSGNIRHLDELGRIVLPAEVHKLGWTPKTPLDIAICADGTVKISACLPFCSLCGDAYTELFPVGKGTICHNCLAKANAQN